MFSYDSALLAATPASPQSIDDVLAGMRAMDALFIEGDGLFWFHHLYLQVTEAVAARVAGGGFTNSAWLADLDVQFAGLYFDALRRQLSGAAAPGCWRALFDHRADAAVARIQFALGGVNAHINHDLPFAIVATCRRAGSAPLHGSAEYRDYTAVNSTLDSLIDTAKKELMVRLLGDPAAVGLAPGGPPGGVERGGRAGVGLDERRGDVGDSAATACWPRASKRCWTG